MSESPSVLLFLGPEEGLKSDAIEELRQRISKQHDESSDEHRFYLPDDSVSSVVDILRNGSLFSAHRLVIVAGVDQLRKKARIMMDHWHLYNVLYPPVPGVSSYRETKRWHHPPRVWEHEGPGRD